MIGRRAARLFETVRRAADDSEEADELWSTLQRNRHAGATMVIEHARTLGEVRAQAAADVLWMYNDPALYVALVLDRGWDETDFRRWLAAAMRAALLPG
ncbi:hypothetical protein I4J89_31440 [Actinoplanes sp. NEAU-A11]|uniref:Uncharacterized protein n=1 Tax=Actinoplanes aureus TaxID=2792083 RepID=A0A931CEV4_9ACTN|nr:hypothetical protein [Actinoplanes aureus]